VARMGYYEAGWFLLIVAAGGSHSVPNGFQDCINTDPNKVVLNIGR